MDYPKFIVSNQREESTSIQSVNNKRKFSFYRVFWLSPHLFTDLTNTSIETDVYAYGSTVWEMFNNGWGPMDAGQTLHNWDHGAVSLITRYYI